MAGGADNGIWLGLLKWSLKHQDGTAPSEARPLSSEDRAFLETVMKEGVRDDVKIMTEAFEGLNRYLAGEPLAGTPAEAAGAVDDERVENILLELEDITEQIDMANTFIKIGGPHCLLQTVSAAARATAVRAQAAACISAIAHNNVQSQDAFIKANAIPTLMKPLLDPREPGAFKAKVLGALSAVVRGHAVGELAMRGAEGRAVFAAALSPGGGGSGGGSGGGGGRGGGGGGSDGAGGDGGDDGGALLLRRKAAFLMKALVMADDDASALLAAASAAAAGDAASSGGDGGSGSTDGGAATLMLTAPPAAAGATQLSAAPATVDAAANGALRAAVVVPATVGAAVLSAAPAGTNGSGGAAMLSAVSGSDAAAATAAPPAAAAAAAAPAAPTAVAFRPLLEPVLAALEAGEDDLVMRETSVELLLACAQRDAAFARDGGGSSGGSGARVRALAARRRAELARVEGEERENADTEAALWEEVEAAVDRASAAAAE